ncbi:MAG: hypothetical protein WC966_08625 [Bradymonadales bacterium]
MGMFIDILKDLARRFVDLSVNERINDYRASYLRNQDVMAQITIEADKALMTFSIAVLAALAVLSDSVFGPYGRLSFVTFACFILVVITVIIGYPVSKALLKDGNRILSANFKKSLTAPLDEGLHKVKFAKLSKVLNFMSVTLFVIGMIFFIVLMGLYIKGV